MQSIKLHKVPGERYDNRAFKVYDLTRNGALIGRLEQAFRGWEILGPTLERVSIHTTIKAAVRVAGRVL